MNIWAKNKTTKGQFTPRTTIIRFSITITKQDILKRISVDFAYKMKVVGGQKQHWTFIVYGQKTLNDNNYNENYV